MNQRELENLSIFDDLSALATRAERVAGRQLSRRRAIQELEGLRDVLCVAAGAEGLPALLAKRIAARQQQAEQRLAKQRQKLAVRSAKLRSQLAPADAWQAWFDGSASPNPGPCRIACVLQGPQGQRFTHAVAIGYGDSSTAEYRALIAALELGLEQGVRSLHIFGDSRVVIDDALGPEQAAAPVLHVYRQQARALMAQFSAVSLRWIPRHKNGPADALTRG